MMIIYGGNYSVYVHINKINGKTYVGVTHKTPTSKRWGRNGIGYKKNINFYNDIQQFGWDNFEHEVIASNLNAEEASNMEKIMIKKLDSATPENGYNFERGGFSLNEDERCIKISESEKGEKHHFYGKHRSEETKNKIRDALSGNNGFWYGKKMPSYVGEKITKHNLETNSIKYVQEYNKQKRKPVRCVETDTVCESITDAERQSGINHVSITRVVNGKQLTAGNYHWEFA